MKIGLTGGLGSGKSTVLEIFADFGFQTLSADKITHELYAHDVSLREWLMDRFGADVFCEDGAVNRKFLANKIFSDADAKQNLEDIVHPLVHNYWVKMMDQEKDSRWVVEIPLLFEKKLGNLFDYTVCVVVSPSVQIERLKTRGMDVCDAKRRITHQLPLDEKVKQADCVIWNNGSLISLKQQLSLWIDCIV